MSADFIDSNVFLYLFDDTGDRKFRIATTLVTTAVANGSAVISYQVVQETLNVLTSEIPAPVRPEHARRFLVEVLGPLWRVMPSRELYEKGLAVRERYGYAFYDSMIIAAALGAGCSRLYSEDLQHGQQIEGLTITNPFAD